MNMEEAEVDLAFSILPLAIQRRIDSAFDNAQSTNDQPEDGPRRKKRRLDDSSTNDMSSARPMNDVVPGGFIIEDPQPGGFVVEDPSDEEVDLTAMQSHGEHSQIPLSLIPTALQILDLQPDDEDVLAVFRNAASGWEGPNSQQAGQEQFVSRKDWRAVCAALLDNSDANLISDDGDGESADEYQDPHGLSESSRDSSVSDDDYQETSYAPSTSRRSRKGKAKAKSTRKLSNAASAVPEVGHASKGILKPTARQRLECRRTFSLFFPDVDDDQLDRQKIMIKDITRVASLLKEKITAEEIIEMLELFSSSPDKSMNLGDFERMMLMAKLA
ncbi:hypothetical protein NLI96_g1974 [Meripilus lineatus]|uniref:Uncharacterized protein n=1 Tax=Meripilus lineatus TaxID=2056292 RepID=A0AAD5VBW2_9APHY|nr:hypothetical protein NLI96_g1974 [Physisporinus lineatus]